MLSTIFEGWSEDSITPSGWKVTVCVRCFVQDWPNTPRDERSQGYAVTGGGYTSHVQQQQQQHPQHGQHSLHPQMLGDMLPQANIPPAERADPYYQARIHSYGEIQTCSDCSSIHFLSPSIPRYNTQLSHILSFSINLLVVFSLSRHHSLMLSHDSFCCPCFLHLIPCLLCVCARADVLDDLSADCLSWSRGWIRRQCRGCDVSRDSRSSSQSSAGISPQNLLVDLSSRLICSSNYPSNFCARD